MSFVQNLLYAGLCCFLGCTTVSASGQAGIAGGALIAGDGNGQPEGASSFSSSKATSTEELPDAPEAVIGRSKDRSGVNVLYQTNMRRFSHVAVAVKVGAEGIGVDLATPLSNKWNLRGGVSVLTGTYHFSTSSTSGAANFGSTVQDSAIDVNFQPHFLNVSVSADWFPWYGSFRVSPGLTLYNGNRATVLATVVGGQQIDVGDGTYTSDPNNPILATVVTRLGRTVAPRLTVGWGNMIPRGGKHFSFPFEVGVEYVGAPRLTLSLSGNECDQSGGCYPVASDPSTQANVLQEQKDLNGDIKFLRFYPVLSTGVSYRF